jgi:hypothetical protein
MMSRITRKASYKREEPTTVYGLADLPMRLQSSLDSKRP